MPFDNIVTLAGKFESVVQLQEYCDAQFRELERSIHRIQQLEGEVSHLKSLLAGTTTLLDNKVERVVVSAEQAICEMQIEMLKKTAMDRQLTLEETKRLDLLIKNLHISKQAKPAMEAEFTSGLISEADLIKLASVPDNKPQIETD
jgi:hypothetical protein